MYICKRVCVCVCVCTLVTFSWPPHAKGVCVCVCSLLLLRSITARNSIGPSEAILATINSRQQFKSATIIYSYDDCMHIIHNIEPVIIIIHALL